MNNRLQAILNLIQQSESLTPEEKKSLADAVKESDKEITITEFKLERTEKVKRTTAILLEETIAELEQKRKSVETQNRELEIEAALERVRSRTMAMHKSEQLPETAQVLFEQFTLLGKMLSRVSIGIIKEELQLIEWWATDQMGSQLNRQFTASIKEPTHEKIYTAWKAGSNSIVIDLTGSELTEWIRFVRDVVKMPIDETLIKGRRLHHAAFFSQGLLLCSTSEPMADNTMQLLVRFGKVFNQTYTRFLDLQKAEAQAREAQIETALERVRSRSLAMHKSEELKEVIQVVYEQFNQLNILIEHTGFIIDYKEKDDMHIWLTDKYASPFQITIPYFDSPHWNSFVEAKQKGDSFFVNQLSFEVKNKFYNDLFKLIPSLPEKSKQSIFSKPGLAISTVLLENVGLYIENFSGTPYTDEENATLMRFGKVFQQTYTRFLDLQKAEAQAREAQIEAALEKVRSRTMSMQKGEELNEVAVLLYKELIALGVTNFVSCGYVEIYENINKQYVWITSPGGDTLGLFYLPLTGDATFDERYAAWKRQQTIFHQTVEGEVRSKHLEYAITTFQSKEAEEMVRSQFPDPTVFYCFNFSRGYLHIVTGSELKKQEELLLARFTGIFEQTYSRFLDLQKAEAQAREAQIEAGLERVRSKTMAMHNSQDIGNTVASLFDELVALGLEKSARCGIGILDESDTMELWTASTNDKGELILSIGHLNMTLHPLLKGVKKTWSSKKQSFTYELQGEDLINYFSTLNDYPDYNIYIDVKTLSEKIIHNSFYFADGLIYCFTANSISEDLAKVVKRFAGVFGQTYKRYLDLLKAEAQARESQIEAALERVRSRTMAMHRSEEIADILGKIFKELTLLDVALNRVLIWIFNPEEKYISWWSSNPEAESNAESYRVDYNDHPVFLAYFEAWQKRQPLLLYTLGGTLKESWEDHLFQNTELSRLPKAVQDGMRSEGKIFTTSAISDYGLMMAGCFEPFPDEINDIVQRFGRVFQQSYTRYVDVQKAEAQAREATIEASLEKVRGKAMSMHNSNDLIATASLVFTELQKLGIKSLASGVGLLTKENRKVKLYSATSSAEGDSLSLVGWVILDDHPVLKDFYDSWIRNEDYFPVLRGEEIKSYYEKVVSNFSVPVAQTVGVEQHGYVLPFSEGLFYGWSEKPYTEAEIKILHRFNAIVDLTFRRYIELQKSEANAVEAIRQASLDRVRAEIASMRTTNDLDRITPLIWKELNILSIPFVRCGVFIMDELQRQIHTFLSAPDGKAIAAFHLPYDSPGNIREILSHWVSKKMYVRHWDQTAFSELGDLLVQQGALPSKEMYMSTIPPEGIHLHCLPFLQGMLYVGNTTKLKEDDIHLIQSVADAFATAYARYEDFNKLESANIQIEKTLMDLKQTQAQLVQSEKMASLGELTAGIAHEIQNPLNFVNNFSEVNKELLTEIEDEITKGNFGELKGIIKVAISNEEKISHHGKRADAIVKGMLQHSRSSNGVKEPTDINALCDEYLRLSYHGLRAKDKSFNAKFETDFDASLPKLNVVPQDIGRVILNLINNALYAVTEKKKSLGEGVPAEASAKAEYEPTVMVSTKNNGDKIEIKVQDNGMGIPDKIKEKIFQPFFTTKPTGQGTGLGLSLANDIVTKGHGGKLLLSSEDGIGSTFLIELPT